MFPSPARCAPAGHSANGIFTALLSEQNLIERAAVAQRRIEVLGFSVELAEHPGTRKSEIEPVILTVGPDDVRLQHEVAIPQFPQVQTADALARQLRASVSERDDVSRLSDTTNADALSPSSQSRMPSSGRLGVVFMAVYCFATQGGICSGKPRHRRRGASQVEHCPIQ
jgi:hypothetical protein